jgi:excisionase family DNA binding protein
MSAVGIGEQHLRSKRQAAEFLGVSLGTIDKLVRLRLLPCLRLCPGGALRFRVPDLEEYVRSRLEQNRRAAQ